MDVWPGLDALGSKGLRLLPHASSLVCYSVTYLEYKNAFCRVVYAIPLSHVRDIRELAMEFFTF